MSSHSTAGGGNGGGRHWNVACRSPLVRCLLLASVLTLWGDAGLPPTWDPAPVIQDCDKKLWRSHRSACWEVGCRRHATHLRAVWLGGINGAVMCCFQGASGHVTWSGRAGAPLASALRKVHSHADAALIVPIGPLHTRLHLFSDDPSCLVCFGRLFGLFGRLFGSCVWSVWVVCLGVPRRGSPANTMGTAMGASSVKLRLKPTADMMMARMRSSTGVRASGWPRRV